MSPVHPEQGKQPLPPDNQPPPPYQPPGTSAQIIVAQPVTFIHPGNQFGPYPIDIACPLCRANITTNIRKARGMLMWYIVMLICLFGFAIPLVWLGCCFIPFCIPSLHDTVHSCPNCQQDIGKFPAGGHGMS